MLANTNNQDITINKKVVNLTQFELNIAVKVPKCTTN